MSTITLESPPPPIARPEQRRVDPFALMQGHQFMNLTTFRKNGQAVVTPVWFVLMHDRIYMVSDGRAGKVKRIRHTRRVLVGPSSANGKPLGPTVAAEARLLPLAVATAAHKALAAKYGWLWRIFEWWYRLRRQAVVFLEIAPDEEAILAID